VQEDSCSLTAVAETSQEELIAGIGEVDADRALKTQVNRDGRDYTYTKKE
jgi:hypothetical protein